jgi:hypothetical protein
MTQFTLPLRSGNAPKIGETIPQLQFSDLSPDEVRTKLWDWAFSDFEDVSEEDTRISVPTTRAMWLDPVVPAAHEDASCLLQAAENFAICTLTAVFMQ